MKPATSAGMNVAKAAEVAAVTLPQ